MSPLRSQRQLYPAMTNAGPSDWLQLPALHFNLFSLRLGAFLLVWFGAPPHWAPLTLRSMSWNKVALADLLRIV